ncbi:MAG TPA: DUF1854 domain-containing protein [Gemmatimonadales bacterium]|nr:DUF1854 domain-containing protein [Gemmatimonadales bacterium]
MITTARLNATRYAPPGTDPVALRLGSDGRLWAGEGEAARAVVVRRCFPWSEPARYISLRDENHREIALVRDPIELAEPSRGALLDAMAEAGFLFEVVRVFEIEEEVEIRQWQVETKQGPRVFQTRLDDWPRALPGSGFLIRDVAGDLYRLPAPVTMDKRSRELLWAFVD